MASNSQAWSSFLNKFAESGNHAGALEHQLVQAESKLKIKLPPSYRAFLSASNGWSLPFENGLVIRPVEDIRWFRKEHKDWNEAYQMSAEPLCVLEIDYFDYAKQDCVVFESKHLAQTLCISEIADDAVLLLNPMVIWPDGEWETWYFSNSAPGAVRYRSFAHWVFQELDEPFQSPTPGELPAVYQAAPGKENRRIRPRQKVPVLEEVLKKLKSNKENDRVNAVIKLGFLGGNQAVEALIEAMKTDPIWRVRWNAADVLGTLRPPEALEALIMAADGSADGVNVNAIGALANYNDEKSGLLLLKILEDCDYNASTAACALAKRGDVRAINHLKDFLTDTASGNTRVQHIGDIAGRLIYEFGEAGYAALESLMSDHDVKVRWRAERGVSDLAYCSTDKSLRNKAYKLLQRCFATETNAELRNSIEISIQICAKKNK